MKKIVLILLFLTLMITSCFAITPEQLDQAEETLRQMDGKIAQLRGYVQRARSGMVEDITLTPEQKQELKNRYLNEKADLVDLYNQLP